MVAPSTPRGAPGTPLTRPSLEKAPRNPATPRGMRTRPCGGLGPRSPDVPEWVVTPRSNRTVVEEDITTLRALSFSGIGATGEIWVEDALHHTPIQSCSYSSSCPINIESDSEAAASRWPSPGPLRKGLAELLRQAADVEPPGTPERMQPSPRVYETVIKPDVSGFGNGSLPHSLPAQSQMPRYETVIKPDCDVAGFGNGSLSHSLPAQSQMPRICARVPPSQPALQSEWFYSMHGIGFKSKSDTLRPVSISRQMAQDPQPPSMHESFMQVFHRMQLSQCCSEDVGGGLAGASFDRPLRRQPRRSIGEMVVADPRRGGAYGEGACGPPIVAERSSVAVASPLAACGLSACPGTSCSVDVDTAAVPECWAVADSWCDSHGGNDVRHLVSPSGKEAAYSCSPSTLRGRLPRGCGMPRAAVSTAYTQPGAVAARAKTIGNSCGLSSSLVPPLIARVA